MNIQPVKRLFAAGLACACALGPAPLQAYDNAADQAQTAHSQPEAAYDRARSRGAPAPVTAHGAGLSANLSRARALSAATAQDAVPLVGEDRAVTAKPAKPGFFQSKMVSAGANGLLGALFGFIALGPWGALGGLLLGAAFGWFSHGKIGTR